MARTNVALITLPRNTSIADGHTDLDATNDMKVLYAENDQLVLRVNNTTVSAKTVTVKAGTDEWCYKKGQGDLVISIDASSVVLISGLEQVRFLQSDGYLYIDVETGMTGEISAYVTL